jgi:hypothetical protein
LPFPKLCPVDPVNPVRSALLAESPKLAADLKWQRRYNAACAAALAAAGKGEDAAKLDEKECDRWRKQALDWLKAELDAYTPLA